MPRRALIVVLLAGLVGLAWPTAVFADEPLLIGMVRAAAANAEEAANLQVGRIGYKIVKDANGGKVAKEAKDKKVEIKGIQHARRREVDRRDIVQDRRITFYSVTKGATHAHVQGNMVDVGGVAIGVALNSPLPGAEDGRKTTPTMARRQPKMPARKKKEPAAGARDPVEMAFALPKGVVLNAAQQTAYDDLKQKHEGALRQALYDLQQANDATAKGQARKELRESRAKIRAGIQEILAMPYRDAAAKANSQPSAGSGAVPQYGGGYGGYNPSYGGYNPGYYPGGYNPGYYPSGPYPYSSRYPYSSSRGTANTGSSGGMSNSGKPKPTSTSRAAANLKTSATSPPRPRPGPRPGVESVIRVSVETVLFRVFCFQVFTSGEVE